MARKHTKRLEPLANTLEHKQALGLLAGMLWLDERHVPDKLGGGRVSRPDVNRYELVSVDGDIEFVAVSSSTERGGTIARRKMIDYLAKRARGELSVIAQACKHCAVEFVPTTPQMVYCSESCRYQAQLERMRKDRQACQTAGKK